MKKNRPGVLLSVIASEEKAAALETILFRETGTFGVRRYAARRHKLQRPACTIETPWGPLRGKRGWREGIEVITPEYEDCARIAREHSVPLRMVYEQVHQAMAMETNESRGGRSVDPPLPSLGQTVLKSHCRIQRVSPRRSRKTALAERVPSRVMAPRPQPCIEKNLKSIRRTHDALAQSSGTCATWSWPTPTGGFGQP